MKNVVNALAVTFAIATGAAVLSAQQTTPPPAPPAAPAMQTPATPAATPDVTLTGCLVQGSGPTVFVFENAKKDTKSATEKGVSYMVVTTVADVNLRDHLNHQVEISGKADPKPAPVTGSAKIEEKDLPTLTAKTVTLVSNTCSVPAR